MIRGVVNASREAIVRLRVRSPSGTEANFDAIVDTGFTSSLTLPAAMVSTLGLTRQSGGFAWIADGSASQFDVCSVEVEWGGTWRNVMAYVLGKEPLLGLRMLADHRFTFEVVPEGSVEIVSM